MVKIGAILAVVFVLITNGISVAEDIPAAKVHTSYYPNGNVMMQVPLNGGLMKQYYESGEIFLESMTNKGVPDGGFKHFYKNGQVMDQGTYLQGKLNGPYQWFYQNGRLHGEITYKNDKIVGSFKEYAEDGKLTSETTVDYPEKETQVERRNLDIYQVLEMALENKETTEMGVVNYPKRNVTFDDKDKKWIVSFMLDSRANDGDFVVKIDDQTRKVMGITDTLGH